MVCTTCAAGGSIAMVIFFIGYDVAVWYSTNPFAVILTSINNGFHFFAGIGNRHFVYQKAKLYGSPIVIGLLWFYDQSTGAAGNRKSNSLWASFDCPNPWGRFWFCDHHRTGWYPVLLYCGTICIYEPLFFFAGGPISRAYDWTRTKKCQNCGKYSLLEKGYHVSYCTNIAPGETTRTCRQVGAHKKSATQTKKPAQAEYQKLYNRLKTRKNRKKISVEEWNQAVAWAQEMKTKAEQGEISEWELKEMFERACDNIL